MVSKSTLLHLRIPFSYFLLPIFLFAVAVSPNLILSRLTWIFVILHVLIYPASNGYNSYFDKDEGSIGGLKNPPPVTTGLYWMALLLDVIAMILAVVKVSTDFAVMIFVYGLVSKAYSHPSIRLKKYAIIGWLVTGLFQGFFTFFACYMALNKVDAISAWQPHIYFPALLASCMLWANYPMTQVYQHAEDERHGDRTLSLLLGVRGTFLFAALFFGLATAGFVGYFYAYYAQRQAMGFLIALSPVILFFLYWLSLIWNHPGKADFRHAMILNFVSATCLIAFFTWLLFDTRNVGRYLFG